MDNLWMYKVKICYPLVMTKIAMKMAIEILKVGIFYSYVNLYQRVMQSAIPLDVKKESAESQSRTTVRPTLSCHQMEYIQYDFEDP